MSITLPFLADQEAFWLQHSTYPECRMDFGSAGAGFTICYIFDRVPQFFNYYIRATGICFFREVQHDKVMT